MPFLSENENLEIGENYLRSDICEYLNIRYTDDIERGVYKPTHYSTIIFFSTINNHPYYIRYPDDINQPRFINGKLSDTSFIFSAISADLDNDIINHQYCNKELLLFIRKDETTGFYFFGRCKYLQEYSSPRSVFPLYCLELLDTRFSEVKGIAVPELVK